MKKFFVLVLLCTFNCGCLFTPQKDNSRFYALGLGATRGAKKCLPTDGEQRVVCLIVEGVPAYADSSQIVKLRDGCEITRSEIHRWAEPIKCSVLRSLTNHLSCVLGDEYVFVPMPESGSLKAHEYKIFVNFTNFIFDESAREMFLSAKISIVKNGKLVALCDYSDRFAIGTVDYKNIVIGMDWALKMLGEFVAQCMSPGQASQQKCCSAAQDGTVACEQEQPTKSDVAVSSTVIEAGTRPSGVFPRVINLSARGEVYVVVDSEDGAMRYFSGRLFNGSSVDVKCDAPYKVTSTNDELLEVR
jgi:uncharacterized lipoprotein YmbA